MNLQKIAKQMQQMQGQMAKMQAELALRTVQASVGGGKVIVTATGAGEITAVKIDKSIVDPEDVEILEDLILSGIRQASENAKNMMESEMGKITGGMGLPKGLGF